MRIEKTYGKLLHLFLVLLAAAMIFSIFHFTRNGPDHLRTRLVTPASAEKASRIVIACTGEAFAIELARSGAGWALRIGDGPAFPARDIKAESFFGELTRTRDAIPVGNAAPEKYGIGIAGSYTVTVFSGTGSPLEKIAFGNTDSGGEWLYYLSGDDRALSRTENDFSQYLDIRASSWAELAVFAGRLQKNDIQEIIFSRGGFTRSFRAGRDGEVALFEDELKRLVCVDVTNIPHADSETLTVILGDASTAVIGLSPIDGHWIMTDGGTGCSYIITDDKKNALCGALGL